MEVATLIAGVACLLAMIIGRATTAASQLLFAPFATLIAATHLADPKRSDLVLAALLMIAAVLAVRDALKRLHKRTAERDTHRPR